MTAKELTKVLKRQFPSLNKWWSETVVCYDPEFVERDFNQFSLAVADAWALVGDEAYSTEAHDCDNFALEMMALVLKILRKDGASHSSPFGWFVGLNPQGLAHAWNMFVADGRVYVCDYEKILPPDKYTPHRGFFL